MLIFDLYEKYTYTNYIRISYTEIEARDVIVILWSLVSREA